MDQTRLDALLLRARTLRDAAKAAEVLKEQEALEIMSAESSEDEAPLVAFALASAQLSNVDETGRSYAPAEELTDTDTEEEIAVDAAESSQVPGVARDDIILEPEQQEAMDMVVAGKSVVIIGKAGTGKTTLVRKTTRQLIDEEKLGSISQPTKRLRAGTPGCVVVSFTRKAVSNIRYAVVDELKHNVMTIHALLEFEPVFYETEDPGKPGFFKKTMKFEPARNSGNPLPPDIKLVIYEESSMIGTELYNQLQAALPHKHQEVFLGDIQQLPPVFGMAVLGFKMSLLPVVELIKVHRQALKSPIITLALAVLEGNPHVFSAKTESYQRNLPNGKSVNALKVPAMDKFSRDSGEYGFVKFQPWAKKLGDDAAAITLAAQCEVWQRTGYYNPEEDIILCPYNKAFGCTEINKRIAQYLGDSRGAITHEVISGFNKLYLAIGDRVLYDKEDAVIVDIQKNGLYTGQKPAPASVHLDRWGALQQPLTEAELTQDLEDLMSEDQLEDFMRSAILEQEDRVNSASHVVTIEMKYGSSFDTEQNVIKLDKAAQLNDPMFLGGYALTVHKAQGSEYQRVFLVLNHTHAKMINRELLYTAITRAKFGLHIIAEPDTFFKGVISQRVKGQTIAEKAAIFRGKGEFKDMLAELERQKKLVLDEEAEEFDGVWQVSSSPEPAPATVAEPEPIPETEEEKKAKQLAKIQARLAQLRADKK